jgi:hypothetical protein
MNDLGKTEIDITTDQYLVLYLDDFTTLKIWMDICDVVKAKYTSDELRIYFNDNTVIAIEGKEDE